MALQGIEHFANQEFLASDESKKLMLRRCNFERFITPHWGADTRKSQFSFNGEQMLKDDALLNFEENN